jgi:hypothetical protein
VDIRLKNVTHVLGKTMRMSHSLRLCIDCGMKDDRGVHLCLKVAKKDSNHRYQTSTDRMAVPFYQQVDHDKDPLVASYTVRMSL